MRETERSGSEVAAAEALGGAVAVDCAKPRLGRKGVASSKIRIASACGFFERGILAVYRKYGTLIRAMENSFPDHRDGAGEYLIVQELAPAPVDFTSVLGLRRMDVGMSLGGSPGRRSQS